MVILNARTKELGQERQAVVTRILQEYLPEDPEKFWDATA